MRRRRRCVEVGVFDVTTGRWINVDAAGAVDRDELALSAYNIWYDSHFADKRYRYIEDLFSRDKPDVMVFQEVTAEALDVFLSQPGIRDHYRRAAMVGDDAGNYGMLMLSQLPINRVTYMRLPTRLARGFLRAEFTINGSTTVIWAVHLDSGKRSSRRRARQLRAIFHALRDVENAVILGDFNMRGDENTRIVAAYCDVWPVLRPDDDGYTGDTSTNLMRFDMKNKHRHVRFDRVLLKGHSWVPTHIKLLGT